MSSLDANKETMSKTFDALSVREEGDVEGGNQVAYLSSQLTPL